MAIKLTVNYVDLKLTVDTDATEAVSTFVFAKQTDFPASKQLKI